MHVDRFDQNTQSTLYLGIESGSSAHHWTGFTFSPNRSRDHFWWVYYSDRFANVRILIEKKRKTSNCVKQFQYCCFSFVSKTVFLLQDFFSISSNDRTLIGQANSKRSLLWCPNADFLLNQIKKNVFVVSGYLNTFT